MKVKPKFRAAKLSMSVPGWMLPLVKQRAESLDLTVSQYIRKLVNEEIVQAKVAGGNTVMTGND